MNFCHFFWFHLSRICIVSIRKISHPSVNTLMQKLTQAIDVGWTSYGICYKTFSQNFLNFYLVAKNVCGPTLLLADGTFSVFQWIFSVAGYRLINCWWLNCFARQKQFKMPDFLQSHRTHSMTFFLVLLWTLPQIAEYIYFFYLHIIFVCDLHFIIHHQPYPKWLDFVAFLPEFHK